MAEKAGEWKSVLADGKRGMSENGTGSNFRTTRWTRVLAASHDSRELGELLEEYRAPIYAFVRRKCRPQPEDADDLTQGFIQHVLEKNLIGRADPTRGKFRTFLVKSLSNFRIDEFRKPANSKRLCAREDLAALDPSESDDPETAAERQYWAQVIATALERLESGCTRQGMHSQWLVFDRSTVGPAVRGSAPPTTQEIMQAAGIAVEQELYSARQTMNRKFLRTLREVIAETVDEPGQVEEEMLEFRRHLAV